MPSIHRSAAAVAIVAAACCAQTPGVPVVTVSAASRPTWTTGSVWLSWQPQAGVSRYDVVATPLNTTFRFVDAVSFREEGWLWDGGNAGNNSMSFRGDGALLLHSPAVADSSLSRGGMNLAFHRVPAGGFLSTLADCSLAVAAFPSSQVGALGGGGGGGL